MYYAVHGVDWFAVRSTQHEGVEYVAQSMIMAKSFAVALNMMGTVPVSLTAIPDCHRYFFASSPLQIRDSCNLYQLADYPSSLVNDVSSALIGLNNGANSRSDFYWFECSPVSDGTEPRRVPKARLSFVRAGYIWSNHGTVWFWAEEEPEWTGTVYAAKKKSQFNLPWVQYKKTWTGAYESLAKVEK